MEISKLEEFPSTFFLINAPMHFIFAAEQCFASRLRTLERAFYAKIKISTLQEHPEDE